MKIKNIKITAPIFSTLGLILIIYGVHPDFPSTSFSLYDFSKGVLIGLSIVTAFVWLLFLISTIKKSRNTNGQNSLVDNRQVILSISMICLLIGTIVTVNFSDNQLLLTAGTIIMCASMLLNIVYIKDRLKHIQI